MLVVFLAFCAAPMFGDTQSAQHWAYRKPVEPAIPAVSDSAWIKNPIDAFILSKLVDNKLIPAPPADRRTLIRRAYFDLIGLPPTPEEVEAFIADSSPDAFAKVVDALLANPHYGERWGRYWLDIARYSDTKGYVFQEERRYPYAYTYRDYVIRSLNDDKPYDRFLIEQLAADQLQLGDDKRPLAAMGFLTLGRRFLNQIPDIVDDRIDVVCRGTMAMTVGCARCHNHKFDPIPTKDYYSLYSIFKNSPDMKDPPSIGAPEHNAGYERFEKDLAKRQGEIDAFLAEQYAALVPPMRSTEAIASYLSATQLKTVDAKAFFSGVGPNPYLVQRWKTYLNASAQKHDSIFPVWRAFAAIGNSDFAARAPEVLAKLAAPESRGSIHPLVLAAFAGNPPTSMHDVADRYGKLLASFDKADPLANADEEALRQVLRGEEAPTNVPPGDVEQLFKRDSRDALTKLRNKIDAFKASSPDAPPRAMALEDAAVIEPQRVFLRGNPRTPGDEVKPHFLTCLSGGNPVPFTHGSGRLELAEAIAGKDNPLTARVMVNRVWLHHFGFGIVRTPSDFGTRGDPPTNPELLDYLAIHFMQGGWSIKNLHRLIMLSATYQMSSMASAAALERDPQNLLLSHFNRQRLDFEATRDALLAVSGKLDATLMGRSVDISGEAPVPRRSIYAFIDRQNLPGLFRNFDFASPDATCPRRFTTTVPQQALFMMNSPFFVTQAKDVLQRPEIGAENDARQKINRLYRLLFNRAPTADEAALGAGFVASEENIGHDAVVWQYGYGEYDESSHQLKRFTPFAHYSGGAWHAAVKFPEPTHGFASLNANGGHPGDDQKSAVIRRWVSPIDGVVQISGSIAHHGKKGDGVRARIVSSRAGELASWNVFQSEAQTVLENVGISKGDTIDFIVDCRGSPESDSFSWAPTLRVADAQSAAGTDGPEEWNAATSFGGPDKPAGSLSAWDKYVQVLLESNEFVFVD
jgi:hypothetical protein